MQLQGGGKYQLKSYISFHGFYPEPKTGGEIIFLCFLQASVGEAGAVLKSGTEADGKSKKGSFGGQKKADSFCGWKRLGVPWISNKGEGWLLKGDYLDGVRLVGWLTFCWWFCAVLSMFCMYIIWYLWYDILYSKLKWVFTDCKFGFMPIFVKHIFVGP